MSDIDGYFLQIALNELDTPHKLSQYILQLPHHKQLLRDNNNNDSDSKQHRNDSCSLNDLIVSNKLSEFIYQQRLNGKFFLNNFTKQDFDNMMHIVSQQELKSDFDWIWNVLQNETNKRIQTKPIAIEYKVHKLKWVQSPWNKYQILLNHNTYYYTSSQRKQEYIECKSVNKCKSVNNLIMVLHFYESFGDQIDVGNDLLLQYFETNENIYPDYQHILNQHLFVNDTLNKENLQHIKDKIKLYVKCADANKCKSYVRKNSKKINECHQQMKDDNINEDNMLLFCSEIMDIIHCYFVHNFSFTLKNKKEKKNEPNVNKKAMKQRKLAKNVIKAKRKADRDKAFTCCFLCLF